MYLYIELWKARPAWLALAPAARQQFFATVGRELEAQIGAGAELAAVARNDADTPNRADHDFVAVWKIADEERLAAFAAGFNALGWHEYFEQRDVRGPLLDPGAFIGAHLAL